MKWIYEERGKVPNITGLEVVCPVCGFEYTHLHEVRWAARVEDKPPKLGAVNTYSGEVEVPYFVPSDKLIGEGRRHRVALLFECESAHLFTVTFTQHKGSTYVDVENYVDTTRDMSDEEVEALSRFDPRRWLRSRRWGEVVTWRD